MSLEAAAGKNRASHLGNVIAHEIAETLIATVPEIAAAQCLIMTRKTEIDPDGRMRTSYNIAGNRTGRFSSSFSEFGTGGNLQNVEESL